MWRGPAVANLAQAACAVLIASSEVSAGAGWVAGTTVCAAVAVALTSTAIVGVTGNGTTVACESCGAAVARTTAGKFCPTVAEQAAINNRVEMRKSIVSKLRLDFKLSLPDRNLDF